MNSIGQLFRLTCFGESHGEAIGGIIDGMPSGVTVDFDFIQSELDRRKPGQSHLTTSRKESDQVEFLSGIFEGKTTGTPIGFIVRNTNQHSNDYDNLRNIYRPSHADYTYEQKYGWRDHRGGGRSSARETISRCVAGALAKLVLQQKGIKITAYTSQVGAIVSNTPYQALDFSYIEQNLVRAADPTVVPSMQQLIEQVKSEGDTIGGVVSCVIQGTPVGLGEPVFNKLHADLAHAMMSINAVKGFDYGLGFEGLHQKGSEAADRWTIESTGTPRTLSNQSGGIQGGISNGEDIYFRVAFKPVATLLQPIETINKEHEEVTLKARGRHDPCVLPRAVPIVEAMAAMVLLDHLLLSRKI